MAQGFSGSVQHEPEPGAQIRIPRCGKALNSSTTQRPQRQSRPGAQQSALHSLPSAGTSSSAGGATVPVSVAQSLSGSPQQPPVVLAGHGTGLTANGLKSMHVLVQQIKPGLQQFFWQSSVYVGSRASEISHLRDCAGDAAREPHDRNSAIHMNTYQCAHSHMHGIFWQYQYPGHLQCHGYFASGVLGIDNAGVCADG